MNCSRVSIGDTGQENSQESDLQFENYTGGLSDIDFDDVILSHKGAVRVYRKEQATTEQDILRVHEGVVLPVKRTGIRQAGVGSRISALSD